MNDKELLELAAKAYGIEVVHMCDPVESGETGSDFFHADGKYWNPLTDDGDALRLAVKLELGLHVDLCKCWVCVFYGNDFIDDGFSKDGGITVDDPYAATRRAIVRAAAEIGRKMK